jgi:hypothetical protein
MKTFTTQEGFPFERLENYREVVDLLRRLGNDIWSDCTGTVEYRQGWRVAITIHRRSLPLTGIQTLVLYFPDRIVFYGKNLTFSRTEYGYSIVRYTPGVLEVFGKPMISSKPERKLALTCLSS